MLGFQLGIHLSGSLSRWKEKHNSLETRTKTAQPLLFVGYFFFFSFFFHVILLCWKKKNRCQSPGESFMSPIF